MKPTTRGLKMCGSSFENSSIETRSRIRSSGRSSKERWSLLSALWTGFSYEYKRPTCSKMHDKLFLYYLFLQRKGDGETADWWEKNWNFKIKRRPKKVCDGLWWSALPAIRSASILGSLESNFRAAKRRREYAWLARPAIRDFCSG